MKRLAAILLSLVAVVAGPLGQAPAEADDLELITRWPAVTCATGAVTAESLPGQVVWATGWIAPCPDAPVLDDSRYAIVYFGTALGVAGRPHSYADPVARTRFAGELNTRQMSGSLVVAACLAYSPTGLLSCVSIDEGEEADRLEVKPIPTDHPRVSVPVLPFITGEGTAYCGTCL